jgi:hypothetical protein
MSAYGILKEPSKSLKRAAPAGESRNRALKGPSKSLKRALKER